MATSKASSSSKPTGGWTYDVFLSFRGDDTRNNFVDHLYGALVQKGIHTFKDDEMIHIGESISLELKRAIEESRFAVVVFSKNYANSSWCLDELADIMKRRDQGGLKVLPVFYHVDPSNVRKQKGDYATAFQKHEENFKGEKNEVNKWRGALAGAANLSGYPISDASGGEFSVINKIVQDIIGNMQPRGKEDNLIGIESRIDALTPLLSIQRTEEVLMIGILGMGGIGKTTIAQALFRRISFKFEGSSFVKNVKEESVSKKDICALQEKILTNVLGTHLKFTILDPEYGANIIQERFCSKKVLLVLDDVDNVRQLEFLAGSNNWFGRGSRILITTRDEHLLSDANAKYKPALLRMDQAVELFSRHAFRKNSPPEGYKELSNHAIRYTGRLPLALKVLGSFFRGREARVWENAIDRLAKTPNNEIFGSLKLSFDGLEESEKKILLDIACFFKGREVKDVTRILDSFGFYPVIGISVLVEKSLITISKERIGMHDLIQEMCWQIVRESFKNSRLRSLEEVQQLVENKGVHEVIEAIVVPKECMYDGKQGFRSNVFERMNNLRLLVVNDNFTSDEPSFLPNELRWITWNEYPFCFLPVPHMSKLVGLEMDNAKIRYLWKGQKIMPNLKFIHLNCLNRLTRFPDVSESPNIERLILTRCSFLVEVHESLGFLKRLEYLEMKTCVKLKRLPSRIEMESLDTLKLHFCPSLERIPEFSPCMVKLSRIDLDSCFKIEELPSSIRYLSNLSFLNLNNCSNLKNIPNSICELKGLKNLNLCNCSKLQIWPDQFRSMINLEELNLQSARPDLFRSMTNLHSLRKLDLVGHQIGEEDFHRNLDGFFSLEELLLSFNSKLVKLPTTISQLSHLKQLELDYCCRIESLHSLPSGIQVLTAINCTSLEKIEDLSKEYECLCKIWLFGCKKLLDDEQSHNYLHKMLKQSFLKKWAAVDRCLSISIPGSKIPSWFGEQQNRHKMSLKLHPNWQSQILGFAICGVLEEFSGVFHTNIVFRFENAEMIVHKLEADKIDAPPAAKGRNVFINYIPFTCFEQMHDDDYNDFQREDWSHITEGNLVIDYFLNCPKALRCGAQVVYKEDVESIPSLSSYYWNCTLTQRSANTFFCSF
ncbi:hypothetical protein SSX86_019961 [Deinandra increscens subsp. villosa]|uniref:ADP-ribosyl cyclase/cyclic ADP-ribose hydrolase n=1 Tax=Deinandra increscens subsp. villosa TaxID=3103831 RepID=A0AAP0CTL1_9ASTR